MANNRAAWPHTLATWGFPNATEGGTKLEVAHNRAGWLHNFCDLEGPNVSKRGTKAEVAQIVGRVAT